jgi:CRP/FNR family cyclic AMP-dependent transcriptional regulator
MLQAKSITLVSAAGHGGSAATSTKAVSAAMLLSEADVLRGRIPSLFDHISSAERDYVLSFCRPRFVPRHGVVFRQGERQEGIFLIQSGLIRVFYVAPSGREITRAYWYPGTFVGGPDVFGGSPSMWSAVAVRDSSILLVPSEALRTLCRRIPNLAIGVIEALGYKGRCYSTMAQLLGTRSVAQRMSQVLLDLAEQCGVPSADGITIAMPFSHEEIAHMVGATRQWVTINLKRLQDAQIIKTRRGMLVVLRLAALRDDASGA